MTATPGRSRSARYRRIATLCAGGILIAAGLLFGVLRLAIALVPGNSGRIAAWIERQTELKFEFAEMDARLRRFGPEVVLRDVRVLDRDGRHTMFATREGAVGLDLWSLFRTGELVAGRVQFTGAALTIVRLEDGRIRLLGLRERAADQPPFDLDRLPAGRVEIRDSTVAYRDLAAGRGPWILRDVDLVLERGQDHVDAKGSARLPEILGPRAEFEARLEGPLDTVSGLDARVDVRIATLELPGLTEFLPAQAARPLDGNGRFAGMVELRRGRLHQAQVRFELEDVVLQLPPRVLPAIEAVEVSAPYRAAGASPLSMPIVDKQVLERPVRARPAVARYATLAGELRFGREGETWMIQGRDLRVAREPRGRLTPASIEATWRGIPATTFELTASASRLDLGEIWPLLLAVAPAGFDRWSALDPEGEIRKLRMQVVRERAGAEPRFAVNAEVAGLVTQATGRWPGITGMTAAVSGTNGFGRLSLELQDASFDWPRWLRASVGGFDAAGEIDWKRDGRAWVFRSRAVDVTHPMVRGHCAFELSFIPGGGSPHLSLDARVEDADVRLVRQVVPIGRLQPQTIAWLDGAFVAGRVTHGQVTYRGPVRKFPFRNGEGEFVAIADVSDVTLDYFPGFAPLTGAAGTATFRNAGLAATLRSGLVGNLSLTRTEAAIEDLKAPVIDVDATATGDVGAAFAFLQGSPLGPNLGSQFMQLSGHGPADYAVRLHLPTREPVNRDYLVRARLHEVTLALPALREPARSVSGDFELHGMEPRARSLEGTFLDGPFELGVEPGRTGNSASAAVALRARGRLNGARLPSAIGFPDAIRMTGGTDWGLEGRIERRRIDGRWSTGIEVSSDLQGLAIAAPRPFAKAAAEPRPTSVFLQIVQGGVNEVRLASGAARGQLEFARGDSGLWELERGIVRFDGKPTVLPARRGLAVAGDWPEFDLGEWLALRTPGGRERPLSDWLGPVDVHLDQARVVGFELRDVNARLQPLPGALQVLLAGPMAEGQVTIPLEGDRRLPIRLDMRHLQLQSAPKPEGAAPRETDPRTVSALSLQADELTWQARSFGRVSAELLAEPLGLRLASLESSSPAFTLSGHGSWLAEGPGSVSRLDLEFASTDLSAAARALGYRDAIQAEATRISARLNWLGGPSGDVLSRLDGTLHLEIDNGQLKTVEPGAGRILGLMSVGDLPRRLSLDFRDVTDEGLAFNTVRGDLDVRSGSAYTQNLLLKGAAVDIGVAGRTGLAAQDYEQILVVSGNPSGPLTVAGALAGGPLGAAGGLLLSQMFKDQLQGLTRMYYRVTGPWSAPVVERVSAAQGASVAGVQPAEGGDGK